MTHEDPNAAAIGQVRQHPAQSLRVIDDLDRFLPTEGPGEEPDASMPGPDGSACHGQ